MDYEIGTQVRFKWGKEIHEGEITAQTGWYLVRVPQNDTPYPIIYPVWPKDIVGVIYNNEIESDQSSQLELQETEPERTAEEINRDNLRKFFFGSSPELTGLGKAWKAQGRCPQCGQEGRIHLSTFVCSKHGTY